MPIFVAVICLIALVFWIIKGEKENSAKDFIDFG
jgi:hypothetical protein